MLLAQQNGTVNLYSLANLHKHSFTVQRNSLAPEKRYNCHNDAISRLLWCAQRWLDCDSAAGCPTIPVFASAFGPPGCGDPGGGICI